MHIIIIDIYIYTWLLRPILAVLSISWRNPGKDNIVPSIGIFLMNANAMGKKLPNI